MSLQQKQSNSSYPEVRNGCTDHTNKCYNILSLDGGGVRGLIPAIVVDYMEDYAYNYSLAANYIKAEDYPEKKVPMT